jgi:predicted  nucleic acid-binding Zn-ribbon protein
MVTDMEQAMRNSGDSPEAQWKTKILMRSSKDAECDISRRLHEFEATNLRTRNGRGQMAIRKLRRDFARVHEQFSTAIKSYERRQHAEVSLLNADDEKTEEFFDRAMREREEEINDIHHSMKKVNAIYEDLAGIVDGQQEQIDQFVDKIEESKATTRQGMEHFHEAVMGMCGPENDEEGPDFWTMQDFMQCATSCNTQIVEGGICSANSMDGE